MNNSANLGQLVDEAGRPILNDPPLGLDTQWDKQAPLVSPAHVERVLPEWLVPVDGGLRKLVERESVVLDLCLEKMIEIVEYNHNRGSIGIDAHQDLNGSSSRTAMVAIAAPLSIELYKQVLASLSGPLKLEFEKLKSDALSNKK